MTVTLCMRPKDEPLSWEHFCAATGPFAVALDGYVAAAPRFDPGGPRINLNHHEDVDRLATRSTCAQTLMAIRQGLFACFRDEQGERAEVYCNDCDEDVCVSWFLLKHGPLVERARPPALDRLVAMEDVLDATAGTYPYPDDLPALQELAWIFEPYRQFRLSGELDRKEADAYAGVVAEVERRIELHLTGRGGFLPPDTRYRRIGVGPGWALIRDIGAQARTGAYADGIRAYVTVRERPDGRWTYTIGRASPFIPFDVPRILDALNQAEDGVADCWGGSDTIGGSPRILGSKLSPGEVTCIVNEVLSRRATEVMESRGGKITGGLQGLRIDFVSLCLPRPCESVFA